MQVLFCESVQGLKRDKKVFQIRTNKETNPILITEVIFRK